MSKSTPLHTDAFFRSQRDINRHRCWLHFWKIQINSENFIFLHFWDSLGQILQKWPYFWAFERKKMLKFWPKNTFFQAKTGFCNFYVNIYEYLIQIQKIWIQDFLNQLKNVQKVENCSFYQHVTFYFWNWNLQFLHLPKKPLLPDQILNR